MYACGVRVLGVDFGGRRVGLALSDASATLATPWKTLQISSARDAEDQVAATAAALAGDEDGLEAIVVGLPMRLDGSPNAQTAPARAFAGALASRTGIPVVLQDERLSSHEAETRLSTREKDWRKRKALLDAAAAAVILQDYLDARARTEDSSQKTEEGL
jgi:putative holliday junction resolvase